MDTSEPASAAPGGAHAATAKATRVAVLVWLLQAALGLAIVTLTRQDLVTGCEGDGHYLRAATLRCGDVPLAMQTGHASWPWLYPWLTAKLSAWSGSTYLAGRLVSVAAMATLTTTVFLVGWQAWASISAALVAAVVIGCTPQLLYYGTLVSTDVTSVAVATLALPFALSVVRDRHVAASASLAGVFAALGAQVRYQVYPSALVLGLVLGLAASPGQRLKVWAAFTLGFGLILVACAQLPYYRPHDWGGVQTAWMAGAHGGAVSWDQAIGRYTHSAALLAWHVDYLPLLGLIALPWVGLDGPRPRREALVLLAPAAVLFGALGWFPSTDSVELRRLFLPMLPVCALGSAAVWRHLRAAERPRVAISATLATAFTLLTVNQTLAEFPMRGLLPAGVPWPGLGFESPQRRWDFERGGGREAELATQADSLDALARLVQETPFGCAPTITNDVLASVVLPSVVLCRPGMDACPEPRGLDNDAIARILPSVDSAFGVRWVLEAPHQGRFWIDPSAPLGDTGVTLVARPAPEGFRLYELTKPRRSAP